jgi:hypothetical protein
MLDEPPPRELQERTGRHYCVRCLAVVATEVYFRNDYFCDECTEGEEYPAAAPPPEKATGSGSGDPTP